MHVIVAPILPPVTADLFTHELTSANSLLCFQSLRCGHVLSKRLTVNYKRLKQVPDVLHGGGDKLFHTVYNDLKHLVTATHADNRRDKSL